LGRCYVARVTNLLIAAVGAILATNPPAAVSNLVYERSGVEITISTNDPVDRALQKLMEQDDAARVAVEKLVEDNERFAAQNAGLTRFELRRRIMEKFEPVKKGYEDLIQQHTNRSDIRIAYASFLGDLGDEEAAIEQLEVARTMDTNNPAIWNNLANLYGHNGEVKKSFEYYAKAIELDPNEPVYYHNYGTTVFLFRKDGKEYFGLDEQQIFDKALGLYSNAMRLDPEDFQLAADVAQTFYGIQPFRPDEALRAWTNAFNLARDDEERAGVNLHFARINIKAERLDVAEAHLNSVTNQSHLEVKRRLTRVLSEAREAAATNAPAAPK